MCRKTDLQTDSEMSGRSVMIEAAACSRREGWDRLI